MICLSNDESHDNSESGERDARRFPKMITKLPPDGTFPDRPQFRTDGIRTSHAAHHKIEKKSHQKHNFLLWVKEKRCEECDCQYKDTILGKVSKVVVCRECWGQDEEMCRNSWVDLETFFKEMDEKSVEKIVDNIVDKAKIVVGRGPVVGRTAKVSK